MVVGIRVRIAHRPVMAPVQLRAGASEFLPARVLAVAPLRGRPLAAHGQPPASLVRDLFEEGTQLGEHLAGDETAACLPAARLKLIDIADPAVTLVVEIPVIPQDAGRELHLRDFDTETPRGAPLGVRCCLEHSKPVTFRELDIVLLRPLQDRLRE